MKILLVQDSTIKINLYNSSELLNRICRTLEFVPFEKIVNFGSIDSNINLKKEIESLHEELTNVDRDYVIYLTKRKYSDNWFWHSNKNIMILSFYGWKYYTNLPIENGLFYFVCDTLVQRIDRSIRHMEITGCLYDSLGNKTAIDIGMKRGFLCEECLKKLSQLTQHSELQSNILIDVIEILKSLSNASRLGNNVLDLLQDNKIPDLDWSSFEDEVSQLYRDLGANVRQNVNLEGYQIDILVDEIIQSKSVRSAVECKFYINKKVGAEIVNNFSRIIKTLKDAAKIDKGIIVSYSGFSAQAYDAAEVSVLELISFNQLKKTKKIKKRPLLTKEKPTKVLLKQEITKIEKRRERSPKIFVIMPFSDGLDDLYHLGILEAARELNCSCDRVDQIEYTGTVMEKIYESITNAQVIIAELTENNPNVYYELGYSHALKKPTILLTKDIKSAPFDLKGYNHIIYKKIIEMKPKLKKRLEAILT